MNRLYFFWQELKRRKVVRRNTVYAATAFVILELVSIIQEPLRLPDWTLTVVIILLSAGLLISIVISWIYDIDPEKGLVKTKPAGQVSAEDGPKSSQGWKIATIASLVVIAGLIVLNVFSSPRPTDESSEPEKSIAVLPLENLSTDSSQVYFCEAMREEILNHLDKVGDFSVRSRTSTDRYRNTEKTSIEIGKELNVNYLIEGSVGIDGQMIKIWLQLIDTRTDEHQWSGDFTRERKKLFALQSEIARSLARELQTKLSPGEIEQIERKPTQNTEAYQAYLRGKYYSSRPHDDRSHWDKALASFREAVALDSSFALAFGALAKTYGYFRYSRYDLSEENLELADQAAAKALELGSDDPEVHLQIGYYYFYGYRDHAQQSKHWEIAARGLHNNVELLKARYDSQREQGNWEDAASIIRKARELDPNDVDIYSRLGIALWFLREYEEADEAWNRANTSDPDGPFPPVGKVYNLLSWKGICDETQAAVKNLKSGSNWYNFLRFWVEAGSGNLDAALETASDSSMKWIVFTPVYARPSSLYRAFIYRHQGRTDLALENFEEARKLLEQKTREVPGDFRFHGSLGITYAGLNRREAAIVEVRKAMELLPVDVDPMYGTSPQFDAILVHLLLGDPDRALEQLEHLLSFPSPYSIKWVDWYLPLLPLKEQPGYTALLGESN